MFKLFVLAIFVIVLPSMTMAADTKSNAPMRQGVSGQMQGATRVNKLGDTATHEVGHYRKRFDKSTPLLKKPGGKGFSGRKRM